MALPDNPSENFRESVRLVSAVQFHDLIEKDARLKAAIEQASNTLAKLNEKMRKKLGLALENVLSWEEKDFCDEARALFMKRIAKHPQGQAINAYTITSLALIEHRILNGDAYCPTDVLAKRGGYSRLTIETQRNCIRRVLGYGGFQLETDQRLTAWRVAQW